MTETEQQLLKQLAENLIAATPKEIAAKCGVDKFVEYCDAVRNKLIPSRINGRLVLASRVGLKANLIQNLPHEKTNAEILAMVRGVFPNASIIDEISAGDKSQTSSVTKEPEEPGSPAEKFSITEPTVKEVQRDLLEAAGLNKIPPKRERAGALPAGRHLPAHPNPMGALPVPVDPDDEPW